jgi:hypothetical protein
VAASICKQKSHFFIKENFGGKTFFPRADKAEFQRKRGGKLQQRELAVIFAASFFTF